jgi:hypothetical protein
VFNVRFCVANVQKHEFMIYRPSRRWIDRNCLLARRCRAVQPCPASKMSTALASADVAAQHEAQRQPKGRRCFVHLRDFARWTLKHTRSRGHGVDRDERPRLRAELHQ